MALDPYFQVEGNGIELGSLRVPAVFGVGLNYRSFAKAMGLEIPENPLVFSKPSTAVTKLGEPIEIPRGLRSDKVDFEGELAVIIGKHCKNVSEEDALDYVAGYTAAIDVTARDWQFEWGGGQFVRGKSFDTFCPLGPQILSAKDCPDPSSLNLTTHLNGELVQEGSLLDLIFPIPKLIAFLSGSTTLLPGTVILTGTPAGFGHGSKPQFYLKQGDVLEVTISQIGTLKRGVIEEPI